MGLDVLFYEKGDRKDILMTITIKKHNIAVVSPFPDVDKYKNGLLVLWQKLTTAAWVDDFFAFSERKPYVNTKQTFAPRTA